MVKTNLHDFIGSVLPLISGILSVVFGFYLNNKKSNAEEKQSQFDRLNQENAKLTAELDKSRRIIHEKDNQIIKLEKALGEKTSSASFVEEKKEGGKNDS